MSQEKKKWRLFRRKRQEDSVQLPAEVTDLFETETSAQEEVLLSDHIEEEATSPLSGDIFDQLDALASLEDQAKQGEEEETIGQVIEDQDFQEPSSPVAEEVLPESPSNQEEEVPQEDTDPVEDQKFPLPEEAPTDETSLSDETNKEIEQEAPAPSDELKTGEGLGDTAESEKEESHSGVEEELSEADQASAFFREWKEKHEQYLEEHDLAGTFQVVPVEKKPTKKKFWFSRTRSQEVTKEVVDPEEARLLAAEKAEKRERLIQVLQAVATGLFFLLLSIIALFFLSPLSKQKYISLSGNKEVSRNDVIWGSRISPDENAFQTALHLDQVTHHIRESNPWIKEVSLTYEFPNRFAISLEENTVVAYVANKGGYQKVLSSGVVLQEVMPEGEVPTSAIRIQVDQFSLLSPIAKQLGELSDQVRGDIDRILLTPSKATKDLLTLEMRSGHRVLVPAGELRKKMAYYMNIQKQTMLPSVIDMEAGIFRYPISE